MHGGPSLRRGDTNEGLNIPSGIGCVGKDIGRLVTWEFHWELIQHPENPLNRSYNLLHFAVPVLYLIIQNGVLVLCERIECRTLEFSEFLHLCRPLLMNFTKIHLLST